MFTLLKLASFALVASSSAYDAQSGLSSSPLHMPSSALRGGLSSSEGVGVPADEFAVNAPNYQLLCSQPNAAAACMAEKQSVKNALTACCATFGDKSVGYTCADGTVFCCTDPPQKQYNDGSPTDIDGFKGCLKAVPDFEEAMSA
jgi:hypothetical protein